MNDELLSATDRERRLTPSGTVSWLERRPTVGRSQRPELPVVQSLALPPYGPEHLSLPHRDRTMRGCFEHFRTPVLDRCPADMILVVFT